MFTRLGTCEDWPIDLLIGRADQLPWVTDIITKKEEMHKDITRRNKGHYFVCIHCVIEAPFISGIYKGLSTGSELPWGNWAAHA